MQFNAKRAARHCCSTAATVLLVATALLGQDKNWLSVGGDRGSMRYSSLKQIHRGNADELEVAWTYRTGEEGSTIECTPLAIDGVLYITTAKLKVVALDAATGVEKWKFDPMSLGLSKMPLASGGVNRGVAYWSDGQSSGQRRILHGAADGRLYSLDAATGDLDESFGLHGVKDLREDLRPAIGRKSYGPTSAPAVWGDLVIIGVSVGEGPGPAAPGDVRAFDVRTGNEVWRFHTVPKKGEFGNETWEGESWKNRGGANAWGGASVDVEKGVVFVGLGSAAFDFYGGDRHGKNLFANCTVALDAATGKRVWHYQTLHHDLWDHDLPIYPNLVQVRHNGQLLEAVAQVTKTGYVFLFDRRSGEPLFPIKEQPVPASDVPGESAWPTQPIPTKPPPFAKQSFTESDVTDIGPANQQHVLERLREIRGGPAFNPPSSQGTVVIPGFLGGATWSGACFDPETGLLYVNANNVPNILALKKAGPDAPYAYGHQGYNQFRDQEGYPAIKPPWGVLNAIDLNRGEFAWRVTFGEHAELTKRGVPLTGTMSFGGAIVTAGGLVFIGGTMDEMFHAYDKATGELLWHQRLSAGGYATPCTYESNGRQFVVIAAGGGGKLRTRTGDAFVAFALPN